MGWMTVRNDTAHFYRYWTRRCSPEYHLYSCVAWRRSADLRQEIGFRGVRPRREGDDGDRDYARPPRFALVRLYSEQSQHAVEEQAWSSKELRW